VKHRNTKDPPRGTAEDAIDEADSGVKDQGTHGTAAVGVQILFIRGGGSKPSQKFLSKKKGGLLKNKKTAKKKKQKCLVEPRMSRKKKISNRKNGFGMHRKRQLVTA